VVENKKYTEYLITTGCSFTAEGIWPDYSLWKSWPYFLGKIVNREVINKGTTAVGNFYIVNKLYETLDTSKYNSDNSIVIVMWSGIDRVDLVVNDEEFYHFKRVGIRDQWVHSGGKEFNQSRGKDRYWYNYYKTYHTEQDSYTQTLQHMLGAQEFLTNRKIPYLFLTYKDIFTDRRRKYKRAKNLENHINWDRFHFPNGEFGGEFEWVKDNNLTWSEDGIHPSEESHKKYAEYLYNLNII
jgi:hypothetical protein